LESPAAPRCYVLDEGYRLTLACPASPDDPLNQFSWVSSGVLPREIERLVRVLTERWQHESDPAPVCARIKGLRITVMPLHGPAGRHMAVFVEDLKPPWPLARSA
jgi:hypothetical protein